MHEPCKVCALPQVMTRQYTRLTIVLCISESLCLVEHGCYCSKSRGEFGRESVLMCFTLQFYLPINWTVIGGTKACSTTKHNKTCTCVL